MKVLKSLGFLVVIASVIYAMITGTSEPRSGEIPHVDRPVVDTPVLDKLVEKPTVSHLFRWYDHLVNPPKSVVKVGNTIDIDMPQNRKWVKQKKLLAMKKQRVSSFPLRGTFETDMKSFTTFIIRGYVDNVLRVGDDVIVLIPTKSKTMRGSISNVLYKFERDLDRDSINVTSYVQVKMMSIKNAVPYGNISVEINRVPPVG